VGFNIEIRHFCRARRITSILWQGAGAWRDSPGLIMARLFPRPSRLGRWQREGRLVHKEDVAVGLENAPQTLMRLFTGENFGKQLLKIADSEI
jgi:NADPH-dependent curcumin reductase CurA